MNLSTALTLQSQNHVMRPVGLKIISIEGNIGSGKSTIIDIMEKMFDSVDSNYIFLREPVEEWESVKESEYGDNVLKKFYQYPHKYGFSFQVLVYLTFYKQLVKAINSSNGDKIIICERSLDVSQFIFAKMLYNDGILNEIEYQILNVFYSQFDRIKLDAVIYLDVKPEICSERIEKRSRIGEEEIELSYLKKCKEYHQKWIDDSYNIYIHHVDGELSQEECLNSICKFIRGLEDKYDSDSISDYYSETDDETLNKNVIKYVNFEYNIENEEGGDNGNIYSLEILDNGIIKSEDEEEEQEKEHEFPLISERMLQDSTHCDNCFNRITYLKDEFFVFRKKKSELYWCKYCYDYIGFEMLEEGWKLKGYDV
jgi:thymidylate kinase